MRSGRASSAATRRPGSSAPSRSRGGSAGRREGSTPTWCAWWRPISSSAPGTRWSRSSWRRSAGRARRWALRRRPSASISPASSSYSRWVPRSTRSATRWRSSPPSSSCLGDWAGSSGGAAVPLLEGRGLCVDYGRVRALGGVDIEVEEGQVIGLLGPNGSGKTTLLNVLGGLLCPTEGMVRFDGGLVTGKPPWVFGRLGIGRTFPIPRPFAGMTALDSVLVGVTFSKRRTLFRAADRRREGERLLATVGLADKAGAGSSELSLGQMKRLELAVALSARPRLLLLDELASGLSPQGRGEVLRFYGRLRDRGIAIVAVEHSVGTLARVADRLILLDGGVIAAEGPPSAVLASPRVAQAYLGDGDE